MTRIINDSLFLVENDSRYHLDLCKNRASLAASLAGTRLLTLEAEGVILGARSENVRVHVRQG